MYNVHWLSIFCLQPIGGQKLEVYNFETKAMISKSRIHEPIAFWTWLNSDVIAMVTENFIFHWDLRQGTATLSLIKTKISLCGLFYGEYKYLFSSPELKAQVSFSDHFLSVVCPSFCLSVNFSHFHLHQNHWANFNQTCHKTSLVEGDSSLFKWRSRPFPWGDN